MIVNTHLKMLTCIACTKQLNGGSLHEQEEGDSVSTPRTKQAVKTLTSQVRITIVLFLIS